MNTDKTEKENRMDNINKMKSFIMNFSLNDCKPHGNQGYKRVLLQLFGYLGHGKSSFINTCKYVLEEGAYKIYSDVGSSDGGKTTKRISYPLTSNITLVDNRGCAMMSDQETGEIYAQLSNLLPLDQEVQWQRGYMGIMTRMVEADKNANYSDFIVPIFVYSVKKGISDEELPEIKKLIKNAWDLTGIIPIVVLTFKNQGNVTDVEAKFNNIGIDYIFKLENFTINENNKDADRCEEVLMFLSEILKDVEFHMRDTRNCKKERAERKKFVLGFAHDTEVNEEKRQKDMELEREREQARQRQREEERRRREEEERRRQEEKNKGGCSIQ
ncbi:chromatin assembly factor 1 subunit A-B-like [Bombina bombina]|uniref:chromatin assembly factor 1 subunit A-B-like n=1 Tax=Bombina bombina TaxID=8345 RepID=UPI00235B128F|nr:chromatin assembly factor 1 subunit A-B-like [Bombina bombina]